MKKRKIKRVLSTSIASTLLAGTVGSSVTTINASAMESVTTEVLKGEEKNENDKLELEYSVTTSAGATVLGEQDNDEVSLPQGFSSNKIGDITKGAYALFDEDNKVFNMKGTGTYIGKDVNATDDYHFVNYKVEGDATIIARLSDFDMTNAIYGQAGVFMRADNEQNDCDYFGVYVEPSKDQYRYAYRGNSNSGAAGIAGLTGETKGKYIKLVKTANSFRYYISDDLDFDKEGVLSNGQTINNDDATWHVGFVVSNGASATGNANASFDEVMIKDSTGVLYSTLPIEEDGSDDSEEKKESVKFNITKKPEDTISYKNVDFGGDVAENGSIKVMLNGSEAYEKSDLQAGDTFDFNLNLSNGRNSVDVIFVGEDNVENVKKYNVLVVNNEAYDMIVDANYSGESGAEVDGIKTFKTVKEAVSTVGTKNTERKVIYVKNGTYKEKLTIESPYLSIVGEDKDKTILTFDDANGTINPDTGVKYGTSKSASVYVKSKAFGFTAENLTIENSFVEKGNNDEQAVALNNEADQSSFINCKFVANQDTLLANAPSAKAARQYYYKCEIIGDVDFIFGRAQAVFNDCDIVSLDRKSTSNNGYITAANTWDKDSKGYLIINSRLLGEGGIADNTVSLGRPWRPSSATEKITPAVTYVNCYMGSHVTTKGWDDMGADSLAADSRFFEFGSYGPGAKESATRPQLNSAESIDSIFSKDSATINGADAYANSWNPNNKDNNNTNVSIDDLYGKQEAETPEVPETPETPEVPEVPETPETPETPEVPEVPETPETPETPEVPEVPETPETPETPEVPEVPETPETPETPEVPEVPETPETPETPEVPEIPETPETPEIPETPEVPEDEIILTSKNWVRNKNGSWSLVYEGTRLTGWQKVDDKMYFLNDKGIMQTGWLFYEKNWYHLGSNGSMTTGWMSSFFHKYYLHEDGKMATGWTEIDGDKYFFNADGDMETGWLRDGRNWFYLNRDGKMATGWIKSGIHDYYLHEDGRMAVGFTVINGKTYYFNSDGEMEKGWTKINNKWYHFKNDGTMTTGWFKDGLYWYYLYQDGSMASNTTIDGYKIGSNGKLSIFSKR